MQWRGLLIIISFRASLRVQETRTSSIELISPTAFSRDICMRKHKYYSTHSNLIVCSVLGLITHKLLQTSIMSCVIRHSLCWIKSKWSFKLTDDWPSFISNDFMTQTRRMSDLIDPLEIIPPYLHEATSNTGVSLSEDILQNISTSADLQMVDHHLDIGLFNIWVNLGINFNLENGK